MLLTRPRPASILVPTTWPILPPSSALADRPSRGWVSLADPDIKELGVGDEQDDPYAARRAELEQRFQSLPAVGTAEYWRLIEQETKATALPLEVLARCLREREQAGARADTESIFKMLLRWIMPTVQGRMRATAKRYASHQKTELAQDLEQECYMQLWRELLDPAPTFFCEHFMHALRRLMDHVEHALMEREGFWKRDNVITPNRVPDSAQDRLDEPLVPGEGMTLGGTLEDEGAQDEYARVDLETDIAALKAALSPEERELLHDLYWSGLTQQEVADRLGITDRAVRYQLARILKHLREDYQGGEEG